MSAEPQDQRQTPEPAARGVDLARAALADARAAARGRRRPGASTPSAAQPRRSGTGDPELLGQAVDALLSERGWRVPAAVGGVMDRWADIVGADIAAHAEPVSFADGVLVVQASSTAWATQLRLLAPEIVRRVNVELGHNTVHRVDVRAPAGPSWRRGRLRVQDGRGPRDTYG